MVLLRKIKSGRRSIVWKFNGEAQYIDGPKLVFVWPCLNRIEALKLHHANDMQYLEIRYSDGRTEIQPGPVALFDDPLRIFSIVTKDLIKLDANEILILYTQKETAPKPGKYIVFSLLCKKKR
jgi:hypothetical protein